MVTMVKVAVAAWAIGAIASANIASAANAKLRRLRGNWNRLGISGLLKRH